MSVADLIIQDAAGRMVPRDRARLAAAVEQLLSERPTARQAGVGLLVLGRTDEALRVLDAALAEAGTGRASIPVLINLADAHRYAGSPERAEPHYREALRRARDLAPDLVDFTLQHLGKHAAELGRLAEARGCLTEALRLRRGKGDPELLASTQAALAALSALPEA